MPYCRMHKKHPHADATYKIVPLTAQTYGVEVTIPDAYPATITSFASEEAAAEWIATHKEKATIGTRLPRRAFGGFIRR